MVVRKFDDTLGAAFCGFAGSSILYGVLCIQVYAYFQRYRLDRPIYKYLVTLVLLLETFHQALVAYTVYYYSIINFQNPLALLFPVWTLLIQVTIGAIISVIVKCVFAMRVWRFSSHNIRLMIVIAILITAQLGLAMAMTVKSFQVPSFLEIDTLKVVTNATLTVSVLADLVIAGSLTYFLHHLRNGSSNTLINGLIRYSIETGAITSACGILVLIFFDTMPLSFIYLAFYFILSKLYSNSLMVTLNTRQAVRGKGTDRERDTNQEFTIIQTTLQPPPRIALNPLNSPQGDMDFDVKEFPSSSAASSPIRKPEYAANW